MKNKRINILNKLILVFILLLSITSYSQKITRGPDIGEIYFLGPSSNNFYYTIYRSTDFGETITCVDSISGQSDVIGGLSADKTSGALYFVAMSEALYFSPNYGQYGSWELRSGGIFSFLMSGVTEGFIFEGAASHSEEYGYNFTSHNCTGAFGQFESAELDVQENICYLTTKIWGQIDTVYLFISENNFDSVSLLNAINIYEEPVGKISRGFESGELYSVLPYQNTMIRFSNDFGNSWQTKNELYLNSYATMDFCGGRQPGEIYIVVTYLAYMGQIRHVFIYHSIDYGETFTVHHPYAYGPDPFYVAFSAEPTTGTPPLTVQFQDESSGQDLTWEWDFENDGIIDSYEQNPIYTYSDTGYYDVELRVTSNSFFEYSLLKEDFICLKDTITRTQIKTLHTTNVLPNPFSNEISIETKSNLKKIEIYDLNGKCHFSKALLQENKSEIIDLRELEKGIYILKIRTKRQDITKKIIKI